MENTMNDGKTLIEGGALKYHLEDYPFLGIDFQEDMSTQYNTLPAYTHEDQKPEECDPCEDLRYENNELKEQVRSLEADKDDLQKEVDRLLANQTYKPYQREKQTNKPYESVSQTFKPYESENQTFKPYENETFKPYTSSYFRNKGNN